jgi:hypothetical protein
MTHKSHRIKIYTVSIRVFFIIEYMNLSKPARIIAVTPVSIKIKADASQRFLYRPSPNPALAKYTALHLCYVLLYPENAFLSAAITVTGAIFPSGFFSLSACPTTTIISLSGSMVSFVSALQPSRPVRATPSRSRCR